MPSREALDMTIANLRQVKNGSVRGIRAENGLDVTWSIIDEITNGLAELRESTMKPEKHPADDAPPKGHVFYEGVLYQVLPGCRMRQMPDGGGVRCQCTCHPYELWPVI